MKAALLGTSVIVALAFAGVAQAADMPVKAPPPPPPVYSWTGCYWGGHVGWGWGRKTVNEDVAEFPDVRTLTTVPVDIIHTSGNIDVSGAVFGGQVGCNYQFANNWVIGVEGSISGTDINGSNLNPFDAFLGREGDLDNFNHVKIDWIASVTGRLGFVVNNSPFFFNNTLVYFKGGGAWAHDRWNVSDSLFGQPFGERTQTRSGWTIGGGFEWAWSFAPQWTSFVEYDYYNFGTKSLLTADDIRVSDITRFDVKQTLNVVKFGLNYHFNWSAPVAARY
jgi:outer membrane immunogenic protein